MDPRRMLIKMVVDYSARVGKSFQAAYTRVINSAENVHRTASNPNDTFNRAKQQMNEKMGGIVTMPMTREEAIEILAIKVENE